MKVSKKCTIAFPTELASQNTRPTPNSIPSNFSQSVLNEHEDYIITTSTTITYYVLALYLHLVPTS